MQMNSMGTEKPEYRFTMCTNVCLYFRQKVFIFIRLFVCSVVSIHFSLKSDSIWLFECRQIENYDKYAWNERETETTIVSHEIMRRFELR